MIYGPVYASHGTARAYIDYRRCERGTIECNQRRRENGAPSALILNRGSCGCLECLSRIFLRLFVIQLPTAVGRKYLLRLRVTLNSERPKPYRPPAPVFSSAHSPKSRDTKSSISRAEAHRVGYHASFMISLSNKPTDRPTDRSDPSSYSPSNDLTFHLCFGIVLETRGHDVIMQPLYEIRTAYYPWVIGAEIIDAYRCYRAWHVEHGNPATVNSSSNIIRYLGSVIALETDFHHKFGISG